MQNVLLTQDQIDQYHRDGYLFVRSLFNRDEIDVLRTAARADKAMKDAAMDLKDGEGGTAKLSLWNYEGDDIYGLVPIFTDHALGVCIVSYDGGITFTVSADRTSVPDLDVFRAGIEESMDELLTSAAWRPSSPVVT